MRAAVNTAHTHRMPEAEKLRIYQQGLAGRTSAVIHTQTHKSLSLPFTGESRA